MFGAVEEAFGREVVVTSFAVHVSTDPTDVVPVLASEDNQPVTIIHGTEAAFLNVDHQNTIRASVVLQQRLSISRVPVDGQVSFNNLLGVAFHLQGGSAVGLGGLDLQFQVLASRPMTIIQAINYLSP